MSEQLGSQDVTGISDDKAHIAEIEEVVVERIESLSQLTTGGSASNQMNDDFTSMEDLCQQLFSTKQQPQPEVEEKGADYTESQMVAVDALQMMHGDQN